MKNVLLMSFLMCLVALPLSASEYSFDIELDENGYYNDSSDFGMTLTISEAKISQSVDNLKLWSGTKTLYNAAVAANESVGVNVRTGSLSLEVVGGTPNSTIKCTVQWHFSKAGEPLSLDLETNRKGKAKYATSMKSGEIFGNFFVPTHNCHVTIKMDNQKVFCGAAKAGEQHAINASFKNSLKVNVSNAPSKAKLKIAMDITGGAILVATSNVAEILAEVLGEGTHEKAEFLEKTDDHGCINSVPYELNCSGYAPNLKIMISSQKFSDLTVTLNGIKFIPELIGELNNHYIYLLGVSLKSEKLNLGLICDGGKVNSSTKFVLYYQNNEVE